MIRRHFIRSIASLAALSAVPGVVRARPTPFALANFADVRPDGIVIRQKHFRLAQPAVLALVTTRPVLLQDCIFEWVGAPGGLAGSAMLAFSGHGKILLEQCTFLAHGGLPNAAIRILATTDGDAP